MPHVTSYRPPSTVVERPIFEKIRLEIRVTDISQFLALARYDRH
jgi:hypothetical protein